MKIMSDSLDTIGVMARSVADCALLTSAVSGIDLGDPDVKPGRAPRIGLCRSPCWDQALPETQALFERLARALGRAGARLAECELPEPYGRLAAAHPIVMNCESARAMGWEFAHHPGEISAVIAEAYATFTATQQAFPAVTEGLDVLVTPSAPGQAPQGLDWTGDAVFNFIWTSLHVPCFLRLRLHDVPERTSTAPDREQSSMPETARACFGTKLSGAPNILRYRPSFRGLERSERSR